MKGIQKIRIKKDEQKETKNDAENPTKKVGKK